MPPVHSTASIRYLLEKSLTLSLSNIWRNKVLSLATIFVIGTIIFIFNIILVVNFIAQNALTDLNKKIDLTIYLKESTTYEQTQNLAKAISELQGVEKVTYTSKEDALKKLKTTHPDLTLSFEKYQLGNPLPASLNITTTHPSYHQKIAETLQQNQYKTYLSSIIQTGDNENNAIISSVSKNLLNLTNFTQQIIFWLVLTFILGGALIILNAIQITIFNRKREITVMKLVGASHWFIRSPFMIESIIYAIAAVLLSFFMLFVLSKNIEIRETSLWNYYSGINFAVIFLFELLITIGLSVLSAVIATHEYLKRDLLE